MGNLYMMTTIVDRKIASEYAKLYQENNLNVIDDFYEIYIMTRANSEGDIMALAKIEILLNN